jgi:hypothetical protein
MDIVSNVTLNKALSHTHAHTHTGSLPARGRCSQAPAGRAPGCKGLGFRGFLKLEFFWEKKTGEAGLRQARQRTRGSSGDLGVGSPAAMSLRRVAP